MQFKNLTWIILSLSSIIFSLLANLVQNGLGIRVSVYIGLFFLVLTLIPNKIFQLFSGSAKQALVKLVSFRREFGITAGLSFALHAILSMAKYGNFELSFYLRAQIILGAIALSIFYLLLFTSSQWSKKVLKNNWIRLHKIVWMAVPLAFIHSVLAVAYYKNEIPILSIIGFGLIILTAIFYGIKKTWTQTILVFMGATVGFLVLGIFYPQTFQEPLLLDISPTPTSLSTSSSDSSSSTPIIADSSSSESVTTSSSSTTSSASEIISSSVSSSTPQSASASQSVTIPSSSSSKSTPAVSQSSKSSGITLAELRKHSTQGDCWASYKKKVYNITNYIAKHPGGIREILRGCGQEIDRFSDGHAGGSFSSLSSVLAPFYIGDLV